MESKLHRIVKDYWDVPVAIGTGLALSSLDKAAGEEFDRYMQAGGLSILSGLPFVRAAQSMISGDGNVRYHLYHGARNLLLVVAPSFAEYGFQHLNKNGSIMQDIDFLSSLLPSPFAYLTDKTRRSLSGSKGNSIEDALNIGPESINTQRG